MVAEMVYIKLIRTLGSGGAGVTDCMANQLGVQGVEAVVEVTPTETAAQLAVKMGARSGAPRELAAESVGGRTW